MRFVLSTLLLYLGFQSFSQDCFNDIRLRNLNNANHISQMGFLYSSECTNSNNCGSTKNIWIADQDHLVATEICAVNSPYTSTCATIIDEEIIEVVGYDNGCSSADFIYVDIIDVKFEFELLPGCNAIALTNKSTGLNADKIVGVQSLHSDYEVEDFERYHYQIKDQIAGTYSYIDSKPGERTLIDAGFYEITLYAKYKNIQRNELYDLQEVHMIPEEAGFEKDSIQQTYDSISFLEDQYTIIEQDTIRNPGVYNYIKVDQNGCDSIWTEYTVKQTLNGFNGDLIEDGFEIQDIAPISCQEFYTTGTFTKPVDISFNQSSTYLLNTENPQTGLFVTKRDGVDSILWSKQLYSSVRYGFSELFISELNDTLIIIGGEWNGVVDFNPSVDETVTDSTDETGIFLLILDENGNYINHKTVKNTGSLLTPKFHIDVEQNILVGFRIFDDFNIATNSENLEILNENFNVPIIKFNIDLDIIWVKSVQSQYGIKTITKNSDGDIIVAGIRELYLFQENGLPGTSILTENNNKFGITSATLDLNGNIYVGGYFYETMEFGLHGDSILKTPAGEYDGFLMKINSDKSFGWIRTFTDSSYVRFEDLTVTNSNQLVIYGRIKDPTKFTITHGYIPDFESSTSLLLKLDTSGTIVESKIIGHDQVHNINSLRLDHQDNIYTVGDYRKAYYLHGNLTFEYHVFVRKLNACSPYFTSFNSSACDYYVHGLDTLLNSGLYTFNLHSQNCCDSIVTINLSILASSTSLLQDTTCGNEPIQFGQMMFDSSGVYQFFETNELGCDSIASLELIVNPIHEILYKDSICPNKSYSFGDMTFNEIGVYPFYYIDQKGCDSTVTLDLSLTGDGCEIIGVTKEIDPISIYPNPIKESISVHGSVPGEPIVITNIQGRSVFKGIVPSQNFKLNTAHWETGTYFIVTGGQSFKVNKE